MKVKKQELKNYLEARENYTEGLSIVENFFTSSKREIITIAVENSNFPNFDGVVLLDLETGELSGATWTSSTRCNDDTGCDEIYRLKGNFLSNACLEWDDILIEEEWEKLQKKYGEEADFENSSQLEEIGVDFNDCLIEFLIN